MTSERQARVVAAYGRRMTLRFEDATEVEARIKGRKLQAVCGDRVSATPLPNESDWLITAVNERSNELTRPNMRGKVEVLAANLDLLVAVCADEPRPDWYIMDRYLCAAELMRADACIVYNKADRGEVPDTVGEELDGYRRMHYEAFTCSAKIGSNVARLEQLLTGRTAIIVGQSGVGKSSLINAMTSSDQRTAAVSRSRGEGRHTTVASAMLGLPHGGAVIDSPGVRDYAPAIATAADVEHGFREIHEHGLNCRFSNCRHRREPGCAVKAAVAAETIGARRYESYKRLLALTERQERDRY